MKALKRGNIVAAIDRSHPLHCGVSVYSHAVVVSAEPLVLVSESSDMRWAHFPAEQLKVVGEASPELLGMCDRRLEK